MTDSEGKISLKRHQVHYIQSLTRWMLLGWKKATFLFGLYMKSQSRKEHQDMGLSSGGVVMEIEKYHKNKVHYFISFYCYIILLYIVLLLKSQCPTKDGFV